jgi:hypothetical protein
VGAGIQDRPEDFALVGDAGVENHVDGPDGACEPGGPGARIGFDRGREVAEGRFQLGPEALDLFRQTPVRVHSRVTIVAHDSHPARGAGH